MKIKRFWRIVPALIGIFVPGLAAAQSTLFTATPGVTSVSIGGFQVLFGYHVTTSVPGYVMVFDAASEPPDGVVSPVNCFYVTTNGAPAVTIAVADTPAAMPFFSGITVAFSTTGCWVKTAAPAYISFIKQ